jgi:hypothetical protein
MGYWSIHVEGSGAHHNPDFVKDANRLADDFVIRLRQAGHEVKRAAFLYDYMGDAAGQTLPYVNKPWPTPAYASVVFEGKPWSVLKVPGGEGVADLYCLSQSGSPHRAWWDAIPERLIVTAQSWNEQAAKSKLKPVSGGSSDDEPTPSEPEPSHVLVDPDDGRLTRYWWHPAEGVIYRARAEGGGREPYEWSETYDLDLGSEVYLSWTWGHQPGFEHLPFDQRPRTEQPIGAHMMWPDPQSPTRMAGGGITFSSAPERYRTYTDSKTGEKREHATWEVQSWAPLTVTPSFLSHGHKLVGGQTSDKHGFITGGLWRDA